LKRKEEKDTERHPKDAGVTCYLFRFPKQGKIAFNRSAILAAVSRRQPVASMATIRPLTAKTLNRLGMAVIPSDFSSAFARPKPSHIPEKASKSERTA
jgi:hypothetical protein